MGMKLSSSLLQIMTPWCFSFQMTANNTSSSNKNSKSKMIRLIMWDGRVKIYERPIRALELMNEHPKHMVCHSDSFCIGQKVPTLSENDQLQIGQSYFLFPTHFFQSVLSFMTINSSLSKSNIISLSDGLKIFDICKTPSGSVQVRVTDDFIDKLVNREKEGQVVVGSPRLCTTATLEKEYKQLVRCKSQQWKPKLQAITETSESSSGAPIKRLAAKIQARKLQKKTHHQQHKAKIPPPPPIPQNSRRKHNRRPL